MSWSYHGDNKTYIRQANPLTTVLNDDNIVGNVIFLQANKEHYLTQ